jgi:hypothetical protein
VPALSRPHLLLSTEDPDVAVDPRPVHVAADADGVEIRFARPGAIVISSSGAR